jgi:nucleotide-binding universal stress UspA family protein
VFSRILVPTDFSPSAAEALRIAREGFPGAELHLLHVLEPHQVASALTSPVHSADDRKALETKVLARLDGLMQPGEERGVAIGTPSKIILKLAADWQADLIVMGTHGRTGLAHLLVGSVAEAVVRYARLPVLIAHEPKPT